MGKQDKAPLSAERELKGDLPQSRSPIEVPASNEIPANHTVEWAAQSLHLDFARATATRRKSFLLRIFIFVGIPTLLSAFYVYFYATPRYVSEIQVVYQSSSPQQSQVGGMLSTFLGASGSGALDMQKVISSYIASDTFLQDISKKIDLRAHYSNPRIDWLDRLPADARDEDVVAYLKKRFTVNDMIGGYNVIDVEAFDPKTAAGIAEIMNDDIDAMVETMTERERVDEMKFAKTELDRAEQAVLTAKLNTTRFQNIHQQFDPVASATQLDTTVVGGLETQLSQYRALLSSRRQVLGDNSPTIKSLKSQIGALEQQISAERTRLASGGASASDKGGLPYSELVEQYTILKEKELFATNTYNSAEQAYELARADAQRKENYVEAFVKPNKPQLSTSPDKLVTILATFVISLLAYAAGNLIISSFKDQAGV